MTTRVNSECVTTHKPCIHPAPVKVSETVYRCPDCERKAVVVVTAKQWMRTWED